jgi:hypothetical protein
MTLQERAHVVGDHARHHVRQHHATVRIDADWQPVGKEANTPRWAVADSHMR